MSPRVLIAGLFHETHTFVDDITTVEQFQVRRGDELLACEGDGSPLGGALVTARRFGWDVIPTIDYRAQPSGIVADEVLDSFCSELRLHVERAMREGLDAIYLVLHGAMVTTSILDVEGELLQRLRGISGAERLPIYGVFDLHANFSERMARFSDCLVAYRENPHTDACAMAIRAAELLDARLTGGFTSSARQYWRLAGIVWPPTGTGTSESPMHELEAMARQLEHDHREILVVNVVAGFAFADTPGTGVSFSVVTTGEEATAQRRLDELCRRAWELRQTGNKVDLPLEQVVLELRDSMPGLTVIAEPSDNIGGGAPGDGTGLLRALVTHRVANAAMCLCDPQAVVQLQSLEIGDSITLSLGGKGSRFDEGPLPLNVELVSCSDGRFALEDRQSHLASMCGDHFDMGPCAVVRCAGITILLTSRKTPPFDLGQWRSQQIEPTKLSVIGVKAAVAHRRAYDPIASRMLWADTPGPCRSDLRTFPYRRLRRPVYPLDEP